MVDYKCPSCGAILKVHEDDYFVKCEYCETVVDLERKSSDISAHKANALAQQIREYKRKKVKVENAKLNLEQKNNNYLQIQKEGEKLSINTYLTAVAIWLGACVVVNALLSDALYYYDGIRIFLDIVFGIFGGCFAWKFARTQKEKRVNTHMEKEKQAQIQREYALKTCLELSDDFDEDFLPPEVRNDDAINFIIKALETERAYTLKQAISQWEDQSLLQEQLRDANNQLTNASNNENKGNSNAGAETLGAFAGAALGALGGAVAREAVKEIKRHL